MADLGLEEIDAWIAGRADARPSVPAHWADIAARFAGRRPAVFLDYDGTLSPIVDRPKQAVLDGETRRVLTDLAGRVPTVIVSGRGRKDVARLVAVEKIIYAGSHGFDIAGPRGTSLRHEVGAEIKPVVRQAAQELTEALRDIEGSLVEDKEYAVAVHFRRVSQDKVARIETIVDRVLASHPQLKKGHGKKVFELRPRIEWDKGKAVLWLLDALGLDRPDVVPVFVGDDTTDEDAFVALQGRGVTVRVAKVPRPTAAEYSVQDTAEVRDFLLRLSSLG